MNGSLPFATLSCLLLAMLLAPSIAAADEVGDPTASAYTGAPYAAVLERFVDEDGLVNYAALKADPADLETYLTALGELDREQFESWDEHEQIALLINAYNAFTLKAIIDHYPIQGSLFSFPYPSNSIRQIDGVWDTLTFELMGEQVTLDAIEHEQLRVDYDEPRIHMAINCASMGCPPLRTEPYRGEELNEQLDAQTRRMLGDSRYFRINPHLRVVMLSPLFHWFAEDFSGAEVADDASVPERRALQQGVLNFISGYLDEETGASLREQQYIIGYLGYDWSLNEQSAR